MPEQVAASLSALVSGLIQNGELDKASGILLGNGGRANGREDLIHAYNTLIAGRFSRNVVSWNSMIMSYIKSGDIFSARKLFDQMVERDTFSWNTIISGYVNMYDMEEASNLFSKMPDLDALSWNLMISGFAHMGNLELACDFFRRMPQKNLVSWNSMLSGYEKNGDCEGAIELFIQMQAEGEKPDGHTLSSILSVCAESVALQLVLNACAHAGLVEEGRMHFRSMIKEAMALINSMPFEPDKAVWGALLGACRVHNNVESARVAAEALTRLEPEALLPMCCYIICMLMLGNGMMQLK
ncbi:mitochondrial editing factor 9 [Actinidia rufa]|uniref:Mitochondrial editing factor 9 n=1 Tax=Actinidia rufa TaxID=165716 RepID=A0A7J0DCG9_9ERIC|nr:mitochondrial editing factor 9 [Actinidia rufa]